MAKLFWSLADEETLIATGDDTGAVFALTPIVGGYRLALVGSSATAFRFASLFAALAAAQDTEDRTSAPDVTEGAGYAENH